MHIEIRPEDITVICNLYKETKDVSLVFDDEIENTFCIKISIETALELAKSIHRHREISKGKLQTLEE